MKRLTLCLLLSLVIHGGAEEDVVRLLLVGPPGAGKGTQARQLAEKLGLAHLSTGDLLRAQVRAGTELGKRASGYMQAGQLVPDELILEIVKGELAKSPGFILDGFPRNLEQARKVDELLKKLGRPLNRVVLLTVDDEVLVERLALRRFCPKCQRTYHLKMNAPQVEGRCDGDGTELQQRADDKAEVIRKRLQVYHEQTAPIVNFYRPRGIVEQIDGSGSIDAVFAELLKVVRDRVSH